MNEFEFNIKKAEKDYNSLIVFLKNKRKKLGYTQHKLAVVSGVAPSMISKIERGANSPSLITLIRITTALKLEIKIREE